MQRNFLEKHCGSYFDFVIIKCPEDCNGVHRLPEGPLGLHAWKEPVITQSLTCIVEFKMSFVRKILKEKNSYSDKEKQETLKFDGKKLISVHLQFGNIVPLSKIL